MSLSLSVKSDDVVLRKIAALGAVGSDFNSRLSVIVRTRGLDVRNNAIDLVPVSTGRLRGSISVDYFANGLAAIIGSFLPYAARQEFDASLNHDVRPAKRRKINTKSGKKGSVIKGTIQTNPNATWGFLRKSLHAVAPYFLDDIDRLMSEFAQGFNNA